MEVHRRHCALALHGLLVALALDRACVAARTATVSEAAPDARDRVHAVWPNGPTHSGKLGGSWPAVTGGSNSVSGTCDPTSNDQFTGYSDSGGYCQPSSAALDDEGAYLVLHSGRLGVVFDAEATSQNFAPKLGATGGLPANASACDVLAALPDATLSASLALTCDGSTASYSLGATEQFAQLGLVRQGHEMNHIIVTGLEWKDSTGAAAIGDCDVEPDPDNDPSKCNQDYGGASWPCSADYPRWASSVHFVRHKE